MMHYMSVIEGLAENIIYHNDNLTVLKNMSTMTGKVKCIYADPPYNTGSSFDCYEDKLQHEQWLEFMRERLIEFKKLLTDDGSLWISIDDNEYAYLKILCDEVFDRHNFVATIIWEKRKTRENRRVFSFKHDYILVFAKDKKIFQKTRNLLSLTETVKDRYKNPDNDPRGPWQSISANAQIGHAVRDSQIYTLTAPSGKMFDPPKGRCWVYTREKMEAEILAGNIYFGVNGSGVPRIKKFINEGRSGLTPETLWYADEVSTTDDAKKHINSLIESGFETPKPEQLIKRIIEIATNEFDIVLDPFAGSGTTGAVAHKMKRHWIMVESGHHAKTIIFERMKKVVDGKDAGGISDEVGWSGGGGFYFCEEQNV